jgi:protein-L-isoaspartate(D-aspartate) O-methyltransferase
MPGGRVISVARIPALTEHARINLREAGVEGDVDVLVGDGSRGLPPEAPFDRVFVTAAAPAVPPPLVEQLREGGRLLIPVGSRHFQRLLLVERRGGRTFEGDLGGCVFVPLLGAHGFRED